MFDLITIGNISIDIFFQGESLTYKDGRFQLAVGGKYFVDRVKETVGGGGANVAIGAAKHGLKTAVIGKIGNNPFKKIIIDRFNETGVSSKLCNLHSHYLNISSILLNDKGEKTIIHYSSPHQQIIENKQDLHKIILTKCVYFGNLPEVSLTEKIDLLHYLKRHNILTIFNLGVNDCRRSLEQIQKLLVNIDILIVNNYEFADLVKAPITDIHFHENIVDWYIPYLNNKILIVTLGKKGSYGYFFNKVHHEPIFNVEKIIDTTGAGDAYTAGFISQYLKTKEVAASMKNGSKYASKIIGKIGAN